MRVDVLSREYPPEVYGGAGVHAAELVRALRGRGDVDARVRCFGAPRGGPRTPARAPRPRRVAVPPRVRDAPQAPGGEPGPAGARHRPAAGRRVPRGAPRALP